MKTKELAELVLNELAILGKKDKYRGFHRVREIIKKISEDDVNEQSIIAEWLIDRDFIKSMRWGDGDYSATIKAEGKYYLEDGGQTGILQQAVVVNHFSGSNNNIAVSSNNVQQTVNNGSELDKILMEIIKTIKEDQSLSEEQRNNVDADVEILKAELNRPTKRWDRIKDNINFLASTASIAGYIPTLLELTNNLQK